VSAPSLCLIPVPGRAPVGHYRPGSRGALRLLAGPAALVAVSRQRERSRASTGRTAPPVLPEAVPLWCLQDGAVQRVKGMTSCPKAKHAQKPKRKPAANGMIDGQELHRVPTAAVPRLHLKRATARPGNASRRAQAPALTALLSKPAKPEKQQCSTKGRVPWIAHGPETQSPRDSCGGRARASRTRSQQVP
jgi:hypothetical protein